MNAGSESPIKPAAPQHLRLRAASINRARAALLHPPQLKLRSGVRAPKPPGLLPRAPAMPPQAACRGLQQQPAVQRLAAAAAARPQPAPLPSARQRHRAAAHRVCAYQEAPRSSSPSSSSGYIHHSHRDDVADIISLAKTRMSRRHDEEEAAAQGPVGDFMRKLRLAWRIFFPEQPKVLTPKEEGKQRLRMILVADRVGMNEVTMEAMRERIIGAVSPYVEIESPDLVEVAVTTDVDLGAIYSVAVPVRRVKPAARVPLNEEGEFHFNYDPHDEEADPSHHFPYGT